MICEARFRSLLEQLNGRQGRKVCGKIRFEVSCEENEIEIDENSLTHEMLVFAFDFNSDEIPLIIPDIQSILCVNTASREGDKFVFTSSNAQEMNLN